MSLKQPWPGIGLLLVLAASLLGWLAVHAEVVYADGLRYIRQARTLEKGAWGEGLLRAVDHPVYPLEIVAAHRLIGGDPESPESWQAAAQAVSVLAGVLLVVPLYLVARELFGDASAWLGCLLTYAVPLTGHVFADALSESTFLLFWTWGLFTALRFLREGQFVWLPPTLVLAALAYLTRPEGLLLPAGLIATLGVVPLFRGLRISRGRWWAALLVLVIGPMCLVGPYVAIKGGLGTKPSVARLFGTAPPSPAQAVERQRPLDPAQTTAQTYSAAGKAAFGAIRDALTVPLLVLALVGLAGHRAYRTQARAWVFLAIMGVASVLALVRLHATGGYCTPRHALILVLVLIPAAASGLRLTLGAAANLLSRRIHLASGRHVRCIALALVLAGLLYSYAPLTLTPLNQGLGAYRSAGLWLRTHAGAGTRVVDLNGWAIFYGRQQGYTFRNLNEAPGDPAARWVVARAAHVYGPWSYCALLRTLIGGAQPVAVFEGANRRHATTVLVYDRFGREPHPYPSSSTPTSTSSEGDRTR
jgi:hypothetical protein